MKELKRGKADVRGKEITSRETNRVFMLQLRSRLLAEMAKKTLPPFHKNESVTDQKCKNIGHH